MQTIGITGSNGFVGRHLYNRIKYLKKYKLIEFERNYFYDNNKLQYFVSTCDVIIHLAGLNRNESQEILYNTNILQVTT